MKSKKKIMIGVCIVGVLAAGATGVMYSAATKTNTEIVYKETTVQKGNLTVGVTESGSVTIGTLTQEFELEESTSGSTSQSYGGMGAMTGNTSTTSTTSLEVEEVYVAVGQNVEAGDVLFKLSAESIEEYTA